MEKPVARLLPDGRRLHLHHGPIDLIVEAWGDGRSNAYDRATDRFQSILTELVVELDDLRKPADIIHELHGSTANRMLNAVCQFSDDVFVTPMAAVAGAVADEILAAIQAVDDVSRAYVNNGGDAAVHLTTDQRFTARVGPNGRAHATLTHEMPWRGIASSGWGGRSHSLGIADNVTVIAKNAAVADAAATLIANAVDLPGHAGIRRVPAADLSPDSDLKDRLVTVDVPRLDLDERQMAIRNGLMVAEGFETAGLIGSAWIELQGKSMGTGRLAELEYVEGTDA